MNVDREWGDLVVKVVLVVLFRTAFQDISGLDTSFTCSTYIGKVPRYVSTSQYATDPFDEVNLTIRTCTKTTSGLQTNTCKSTLLSK